MLTSIFSPKAIDSLADKLPELLPLNKRCAAARAISRHGLHTQPLHEQLKTRRLGGLHPAFFPAHPKGSPMDSFGSVLMRDDSTKDIFDAVSIKHPLN